MLEAMIWISGAVVGATSMILFAVIDEYRHQNKENA